VSQTRRWEIAENLHRADLTTLQRNEQVAEWIVLTEADAAERVLSQVATKPLGGRPSVGIRAAARKLGVDKDSAYRATKIAKISSAAKDAARSAGLENNQSALLKIAAAPADRQPAVVHDIAAARLASRNPLPSSDPDLPYRLWIEEGRRWFGTAIRAPKPSISGDDGSQVELRSSGIAVRGDGMIDTGQRSAEFLAVVIENRELRQQLAEVRDQCVELAVDAGDLHAEIEALKARLAQAESDRDAWRAEAERDRRRG
jgi:hypothetical protein